MTQTFRRLVVGTALTCLAGCDTGAGAPPHGLVLATTTSVENSGLLASLLPAFRSAASTDVGVHQAGSGRALKMLRDGQADVAITHAPQAEARALRQSPHWWYRKIMFNDFVIVGPPDDPARASGATSAVEAMRRIAGSGARFISRGDESGTHERERQLWALARVEPARDRLVIAGSGMGSTLRIASAMEAYTLTDRATFSHFTSEALRLIPVAERDAILLNTYAVVVATDEGRAGVAEAMRFGRWLAEGEGREVIARFKIRGIQAFQVWPLDRQRADPSALPR